MSFFAGLETEAYDRQYTDRQLVQRMISYFRPYKASFVLIVILLLIIALAGAATPIIVSRGVDIMGQQLNPRDIALLTGAVLLAESLGAN
jgi:ABC-type multidrug transport system fused ATPase/permease subunit